MGGSLLDAATLPYVAFFGVLAVICAGVYYKSTTTGGAAAVTRASRLPRRSLPRPGAPPWRRAAAGAQVEAAGSSCARPMAAVTLGCCSPH